MVKSKHLNGRLRSYMCPYVRNTFFYFEVRKEFAQIHNGPDLIWARRVPGLQGQKAPQTHSLLRLSNIIKLLQLVKQILTLFFQDQDSCQRLFQLPSGLPLLPLLQTLHACCLHSSGRHCSRYFLSQVSCLLVFGIWSLIIVLADAPGPIIVEETIYCTCFNEVQ